MYPYGSYDPAVHGEEGRPDLSPQAIRRYIASDPAVHGEDRSLNADPQVLKDISDIFKASKGAREKVIQEQKDAWEREKQARDEQTVDLYRQALSYAKAPDPHSGQEYDLPPIPPQNLGGSQLAAAAESMAYYVEIGFDAFKQIESLKGPIKEDVEHFRTVQEKSAETTREASAQLQTEIAAREQGIAVIQTEIPLLDERRAALAGSNDQTQLTTAAEVELTAMRAESITKQREMITAFMGSLTGQDERLTSGSSHGNSGSSGNSGTQGSSTDSIAAERARLLASPPPPNVAEIFEQQARRYDLSGFTGPEDWWRAHVAHVAKLKYGYAQGTAFAPGGLALVGEMGPELVNLPRGSQVIPNPRLGGDVHVHLNVEGSVVAERDLAQRLRQELIRTSRRTVDLGFN